MEATITIDQALLDDVESRSGIQDPEEAVNAALTEYIRIQKLKKVFDLAGTVDFDPDWDYRKLRGKTWAPGENRIPGFKGDEAK
jgi:hypothetical protein